MKTIFFFRIYINASLIAFDENRTQSALSLAHDVILWSIISYVYPEVYVSSSKIKKRDRNTKNEALKRL